ncbi:MULTISPECIES: S8 family serine peptidase [unclassified Thiocapsa]|uniref:S8 family peptidase n=1 Tax=unclassified Thiocapsa TaxID=2641286 RepID=UPI0035B197C7
MLEKRFGRLFWRDVLAILVLGSISVPCVADQSETVSEEVFRALETSQRAIVVVALQRHQSGGISAADRADEIFQTQDDVLRSLGAQGYRVLHRYRSVFGLTLLVESRLVLERLAIHPLVRRVDLDVGGTGHLDQSRVWIGADVAHGLGITGQDTIVAVLDTGIDTNHPDLSDDLVREHCICNTGTNCCPTGGNFGDGPGSAEDDQGHGTHVAGIVTSSGTVAPMGVAPDSAIVAVKVMDANNGFCCSSDIVAALDWVLNSGLDVDVVNMSLGTFARFSGDCDSAAAWTTVWGEAIDALRSRGILSVVSSGNESDKGAISAPACLSGAVAVGATFDNADVVAGFSNSSTSLDLLAPGVSITSSIVGGSTATWNGTSMAAPHVAGGVALMRDRTPGATAQQLLDCSSDSPVNVTDTNGVTRARIDIPSALDCIASGPACSASSVVAGLRDEDSWLDLLHGFRDVALSNSRDGRWLIEAYYRHDDEVVGLLTAHPRLGLRALRVLKAVRPQLHAAALGNTPMLSETSIHAIHAFARALQEQASPELYADLERFLLIDLNRVQSEVLAFE